MRKLKYMITKYLIKEIHNWRILDIMKNDERMLDDNDIMNICK